MCICVYIYTYNVIPSYIQNSQLSRNIQPTSPNSAVRFGAHQFFVGRVIAHGIIEVFQLGKILVALTGSRFGTLSSTKNPADLGLSRDFAAHFRIFEFSWFTMNLRSSIYVVHEFSIDLDGVWASNFSAMVRATEANSKGLGSAVSILWGYHRNITGFQVLHGNIRNNNHQQIF